MESTSTSNSLLTFVKNIFAIFFKLISFILIAAVTENKNANIFDLHTKEQDEKRRKKQIRRICGTDW